MESDVMAEVLRANGFRKRGAVWSLDCLISSGPARMRVESAEGGWKTSVRTALGEKEAVLSGDVMLDVLAQLLAA